MDCQKEGSIAGLPHPLQKQRGRSWSMMQWVVRIVGWMVMWYIVRGANITQTIPTTIVHLGRIATVLLQSIAWICLVTQFQMYLSIFIGVSNGSGFCLPLYVINFLIYVWYIWDEWLHSWHDINNTKHIYTLNLSSLIIFSILYSALTTINDINFSCNFTAWLYKLIDT